MIEVRARPDSQHGRWMAEWGTWSRYADWGARDQALAALVAKEARAVRPLFEYRAAGLASPAK